LNDMSLIDPMYQFSLDAYINLFMLSIAKSKQAYSLRVEERINNLNDYHTYSVYRYTCRGLFEAHKLLLSFQMCVKILEVAGKLNMDEYNIFLRGIVVRNTQTSCDLDHNYNELKKMVIVRFLRQDRVSFCITSFIIKNLGPRFVEPPVLDMKAVVEESTSCSPLIFVLSPGVDPTGSLLQLAKASGMSHQFSALSLGQGQAPIKLCCDFPGHWVFLANCHLSLSWMPELDKLIKELPVQNPEPNFRLWLSSSPHPDFPITILQAGIKMTTEPPKVHKHHCKHENLPQFNRCTKGRLYKKLLYALCFFHSILLERKKFRQMGWNIIYGFNDSDFEVSENLLCLYLDKYEEIPWDALKYLIAGVNYGGHVTDEWDRRLLTTYINDYFCEGGPLSSFQEHINTLPATEHPEVFGEHPNADIASQIAETRTLFETLLSLQPQHTGTAATGAGARPKDAGNSGFIKNTRTLTSYCVDSTSVSVLQAYPSLKPLAAWTRDLSQRVDQFARWAEKVQPPVLFWLSGFTFPNGFLTAVLQFTARQHNVSAHRRLCVPFLSVSSLIQDGVYVKGLYLEGAGWDRKNSCLVEADHLLKCVDLCNDAIVISTPSPRAVSFPSVGMYLCPCYYFPVRAGKDGRPAFVVAIELKSGAVSPDHWVKRGTALLLSLDN
uniref:Uncharacterized protein n=1 Tax=Xiphophorus couchianus TaxID=32473 RepID=A0A3B5L7L8_9TELE